MGTSHYYEDSDDEALPNRSGLPLSTLQEWYKHEPHIGYTIQGKKLMRTLPNRNLDRFLSDTLDPDSWRTIEDQEHQRRVRLTDAEVQAIQRIRARHLPASSFDHPDSIVEFDYPNRLHPTRALPPSKAQFLPSVFEKKKILRLSRLIKKRLYPTKKTKQKLKSAKSIFDLWGTAIRTSDPQSRSGVPAPLPAPKEVLPGHIASYNPPEEYVSLKKKTEKDPDRYGPGKFKPTRYSSLRIVPAYHNALTERFNRMLDLYLCPRAIRKRMNVDPESLLPSLPSLKEFKPFPSHIRVEYCHTFGNTDRPAIHSLSLDTRGNWLATGSEDSIVRIFDVLLGQCWLHLTFSHPVKSVAWHPIQPILAIGSGTSVYIVSLDFVQPQMQHNLNLSEKASTFNLSTLYSSTKDNLPSGWSMYSQSTLHLSGFTDSTQSNVEFCLKIEHEANVEEVVWHNKGNYLAALCPESSSPMQQCVIHCIPKLRSIRPFRKAGNGDIRSVAFHPTKSWFFVAYNRGMCVIDLKRKNVTNASDNRQIGGVVKKLIGADYATRFDIHKFGQHVIVGTDNNRVIWFDMDLNDRPYKILRYQHGRVSDVAFHKNYPLMASSSDDGSIRILHTQILDSQTQDPVIVPLTTLKVPKSSLSGKKSVTRVIWHPTRHWIITSSLNGSILLWA